MKIGFSGLFFLVISRCLKKKIFLFFLSIGVVWEMFFNGVFIIMILLRLGDDIFLNKFIM